MRLPAFASWLTLWSACAVHAAEVTPIFGRQPSQTVGVAIRGLKFPSTLRQELASGLTNRILIRVTLAADTRVLGDRVIELSIKYDLWDEEFLVTSSISRTQSLRSIDAVIAYVQDLRLEELFPANALLPGTAHVLRVDAMLNPIDQERMAKIRQWIAENRAYGPSGTGSAPNSAGPNALFNRIFEQYSAGSDIAAAWRERVVSAPFLPERAPP